MDSAMIVMLVLIAAVIALLAWFEIAARRSEANTNFKPRSTAQSGLETVEKENQTEVESDTHKKKAA